MTLKGKIVLVTGAGHGIGRGCALELARAGADLVINDLPESSDLEETKSAIEALGRKCVAIHSDVFSQTASEDLIRRAIAEMETIDVLVSNPASDIHGSVLELSPDDFRKTLDDVLISHFTMVQLVAREMVKRARGGKIIFISSVYGRLNRKKHVGYDTAKAGMEQMMRVFARELAEHNINVNAIAPGFTDTPGERAYADQAKVKEIADGLPFGRAGTPEDIGQAAVYLASADYVTGTVLTVDGGMSLVDYTYSKTERR